jgi:translation initiation factor 2B subunit (eIF-2B alpha/beta/delta family)
VEDAVEKILADRVSGASEIETRTLELLSELPDATEGRELTELTERLLETFPQMANIQELVAEIQRAIGEDPARAIASLREIAARRLAEQRQKERRLSDVVAPLLPEGDLLVFTLSKSGTVLSVLEDLHAAGRRLAVLVAESRPGAEGARMARDLAERGIRSRACDDFLLLSLVPPEAAPRRPPGYVGSPVVLVGADAVHPDALVNKVGTRALLETASHVKVPAYVLASSAKLRSEEAPRALGSLFETIPRHEVVVLTERGREPGGEGGTS